MSASFLRAAAGAVARGAACVFCSAVIGGGLRYARFSATRWFQSNLMQGDGVDCLSSGRGQ
ncbi:hypothetical protein [Streptomyces sp. NPDC050564]|uniref:hypothetical protein n=1 Tax=Streptomyces sp. NPDC050564 TaxID=3365631 RepID=UPI00378E5A47